MNADTRFVAPLAVEAWDAWFRWRTGGELRDRTVDSTWERVADAIASAEGAAAPGWSRRFAEAFADWQMLPDERLLESAGTGGRVVLQPAPVAVLNAAAFVQGGAGGPVRFDRSRLASAAALAVRLLDDALMLFEAGAGTGLRIGLIGMADALAQCGLAYDSDAGRHRAREIAQALQEGCLAGAIELAAERGPAAADDRALARRWRACGLDSALIADALRWGVRHSQLSAITPHPRLALLANNLTDALDPMLVPAHSKHRQNLDAEQGGAIRNEAWRAQPAGDVSAPSAESRAGLAWPDPTAQLRMRAAVQPCIDAPIDYPLVTLREPGHDMRTRCAELARDAGLPVPRWRLLEPDGRPDRA